MEYFCRGIAIGFHLVFSIFELQLKIRDCIEIMDYWQRIYKLWVSILNFDRFITNRGFFYSRKSHKLLLLTNYRALFLAHLKKLCEMTVENFAKNM